MRETEPKVRLGAMEDDGIAPSVFALVERGVERRPQAALALAGKVVELHFAEGYATTRISFGGEEIVVEDVAGDAVPPPDVVIHGPLPEIVRITAAPLVGGVPKPTTPHGRAALASVASGRVRIEGRRAVARRLLMLLRIELGPG
jgi:hypothetical protein